MKRVGHDSIVPSTLETWPTVNLRGSPRGEAIVSDSRQASEFDSLVEQLLDPSTRRIARQKLVAARAVDALLKCLESTNESVVWAAVQSLEELRATEAVGPLVEMLARGVLVVDVTEALTRITGQDFGTNVAQWQKWLESSGEAGAARLNAAECVRRTGEYLGPDPQASGNPYRFKPSRSGDRTHTVAALFGLQGSGQ